MTAKQRATLVVKIARTLYEDDRRRDIARAKEANRNLRADSFLRVSETRPTWSRMRTSGLSFGEHPVDRYMRYAETALRLMPKPRANATLRRKLNESEDRATFLANRPRLSAAHDAR